MSLQLDDVDGRLAQDVGAGAGARDAQLGALEARLRQLEERVAIAAEADGSGLGAADQRMAETVERLTERLDQLQAGIDGETTRGQSESAELRQALADVRAAIPPPAEDVSSRLQAVEKQAQRNTHEMSEIGELHAALDAGLGILRSEIVDVRSAMKRVSDGQADLDDRLETFFRAFLAPGEEAVRVRKGRKGAEADRMGTLAAAIEDLLREQRQLKAEVASLAQNAVR